MSGTSPIARVPASQRAMPMSFKNGS